MTEYFEGVPSFENYDILSASGHVEPLRRLSQAIFDDITGVHGLFSGTDQDETYEGWFLYQGTGTTLFFTYEVVTAPFSFRIYKDAPSGKGYSTTPTVLNATLKTTAGSYTVSQSLANESGLTPGRMYRIQASSQGARVWEVVAVLTVTQPTLTDFDNDPTRNVMDATKWNNYATYLSNLNTLMSFPRAAVTGGRNRRTRYNASIYDLPPSFEYDLNAFIGSFIYRGQGFLYYKITVIAPEKGSEYGNFSHADIYIKNIDENYDAPLKRLRHGNKASDSDVSSWGVETEQFIYSATNGANYNASFSHTFTGYIDLSKHSLSLVTGDTVKVRVRSMGSTTEGNGRGVQVESMFLVPGATPVLGAYTPIQPYVYGERVNGLPESGETEAPHSLQYLKRNLQALDTGALCTQYPVRIRSVARSNDWPTGGSHWRIRHNRYLIYSNAKDTQPKIIYKYNSKKDVEVGLTSVYVGEKENKVGVFDLNSANGLFVGVEYKIQDVIFATEWESADVEDLFLAET